MISLDALSADEWLVTVVSRNTTKHRVRVSSSDLQHYAAPDAETLLKAAFRFLLEREGNESILASFDITVIERYFPDFPRQLPGYLAGA